MATKKKKKTKKNKKKKKQKKPVKKKFEGNFDEDSLSKDHSAKNELDEIYNHIADGT